MISVILSSNACTRSSNITTYVTNRSPRKAQASQAMKEIVAFTSLGLGSQHILSEWTNWLGYGYQAKNKVGSGNHTKQVLWPFHDLSASYTFIHTWYSSNSYIGKILISIKPLQAAISYIYSYTQTISSCDSNCGDASWRELYLLYVMMLFLIRCNANNNIAHL